MPLPLWFLLFIPLLIAALWAMPQYVNHLPERLSQQETLVFGQARFPLVAQSPASSVYDYDNPQVSGEAQPQTLTVR
jgi:hypothetical protein